MTNKFANAFGPLTSEEKEQSAQKAAVMSVQASLYGRLKKTHGSRSGTVGWALIRLTQTWHPDHDAAAAALAARPYAELDALVQTVIIARKTAVGPNAELLGDIMGALIELRNARSSQS